MKALRSLALVLLASAVAGLAVAQSANLNTSGPSKNDYRLRVIQPVEGATITGSKVQVIVDTEIPAERDMRHDSNSMPHPDVDVFMDETLQGTMRNENNVVDIENIAPGPHKIVVLAKNRTGEVIDRKEIHISAIAPSVAAAPAVSERPVKPAPAPAPAPAAQSYVPPAPPAPVSHKLPKTGTSDPLLAAAGLALLLGGMAIRRFA
jgi:LPXTG-motif cell wall-anchored protein